MLLPDLNSIRVTRRQEISFSGLNFTDGARAGELSACDNLSTRRFPLLSPRRGRKLVSDSGASSIFEWDGKLVEVIGGGLYYDGELIGSVTPGEKQFAVVNTKLCVFPDKVYIDLTNNTLGYLGADITTTGDANSITLTGSSFKAALHPEIKRDIKGLPEFFSTSGGDKDFLLYVYGTDANAVEACYDGVWDVAALNNLTGYRLRDVLGNHSSYMQIEVGEILIPARDMDYTKLVHGSASFSADTWSWTDQLPDTRNYNGEGYYGVVTAVIGGLMEDDGKIVVYDLYHVGTASPLFSRRLKFGDIVDISGTLYGFGDAEKAKIIGIDDETNTLAFADDTFTVPTACVELAEDFVYDENRYGCAQFLYDGTYYLFVMPKNDVIPAGSVVFITDGAKVLVWSQEEKHVIKEYEADQTTTAQQYALIDGAVPYDTSAETVSVKRPVPDFDFICEQDNRLWGVSNRQENTIWSAETKKFETFTSRCIYASALGDPTNFWTFEGLSTDAWQVAVGSEGDFTAMCRFDGVCCWKERKLYRVTGSYPAEYYLFDRDVDGVQAGSGKSLAVIDETLFYKGVSGVYAYRGGTPQLVSSALGNHRYDSAVAGSDGQRYYISMREDNTWGLYTYDTQTSLWMHEDGAQAVDFCVLGGKLLMLDSGGRVLQLDDDSWEDPKEDGSGYTPVQWSATFAPFDERDMHERKYYLRILLRVEIESGGTLFVYVKNGGAWKLLNGYGEGTRTIVIPIFPNRVDEMQISLVGTAPSAVLSLAREYTVGSIYGEEGVAP